MDEATENLIFDILLQDSREFFEEQQAQARPIQARQEELAMAAEDSERLQG